MQGDLVIPRVSELGLLLVVSQVKSIWLHAKQQKKQHQLRPELNSSSLSPQDMMMASKMVELETITFFGYLRQSDVEKAKEYLRTYDVKRNFKVSEGDALVFWHSLKMTLPKKIEKWMAQDKVK